jgi:hypothetical protein
VFWRDNKLIWTIKLSIYGTGAVLGKVRRKLSPEEGEIA